MLDAWASDQHALRRTRDGRDDDFSLRTALLREIRDAVSAERVDGCKSSSPAAIGALAAASHAGRPIVFLYVICIILSYAPFALLSRDKFTQDLWI